MTSRARWSWLLVLLLATLGGVGGYAGSGRIEPIYQATTTLFVGSSTDTLHVTKEDIDTSILLASTYGALIRSEAVLGGVVQDLDLKPSSEDLKERVHVDLSFIPTPTISVSVRAGSAEQATAIANTIADRTVALSPAGPGGLGVDEPHAFASRQAAELEADIRAGERQISLLEPRIASSPSARLRASLRSKIREQFGLIDQWRANYTLVKLLSGRASPNIVQVLEPAQSSTNPLFPNRTMFAVLGVAAGAVGGIALIAANPRRRRRGGDRGRRGVSTLDAGRSIDSPRLDQSAALIEHDPWVQELTA